MGHWDEAAGFYAPFLCRLLGGVPELMVPEDKVFLSKKGIPNIPGLYTRTTHDGGPRFQEAVQ